MSHFIAVIALILYLFFVLGLVLTMHNHLTLLYCLLVVCCSETEFGDHGEQHCWYGQGAEESPECNDG